MATANGAQSGRQSSAEKSSTENASVEYDQLSESDLEQDYYATFLRLPDEIDEEGAIEEARFSVEELLGHLIHRTEVLAARDLFVLSDLTRQDAELVRRDWLLIPVEQRRQLVHSLIHVADEDIEWQLGRLLRIALDDPDVAIRKMAIEGLWEDTGTDLLGPLVRMLYHDEAETIRVAAAAALGAYVLAGELDEVDSAYAMRAEEALLSILQNPDEALAVQRCALESIAYSSETGIRQLIEDAYYSPEEELRISSLVAMGRSADTRWRGLVRAELHNPSPQMRVEAARACGELEIQKAERELLALLGDEEQVVRLAVIFALGRMGGRRAQEALRVVANGENAMDAEAADLSLEELLFYTDSDDLDLLDEEDEELDDWDLDPWDTFDELDDDDFGAYDDD